MVIALKQRTQDGYVWDFIESTGCKIKNDEHDRMVSLIYYQAFLEPKEVMAENIAYLAINGNEFIIKR